MWVASWPAGGSLCIPHAVWRGKVMDGSSHSEATFRRPCHCLAGHPVILVAFMRASCWDTSGEVRSSSLDVTGAGEGDDIRVSLLDGFWVGKEQKCTREPEILRLDAFWAWTIYNLSYSCATNGKQKRNGGADTQLPCKQLGVKADTEAHTCNPNIWETEIWRCWGQEDLERPYRAAGLGELKFSEKPVPKIRIEIIEESTKTPASSVHTHTPHSPIQKECLNEKMENGICEIGDRVTWKGVSSCLLRGPEH